MDLDEEVTPTKSNIIEVNAPLNNANVESTAGSQTSITDPRLRSKKQTPLPSLSQETGGESQVTDMTADELMQKAREQMAVLAQTEKIAYE
jgi:ribosome assembly protein YihI (activator of Der GTPase)